MIAEVRAETTAAFTKFGQEVQLEVRAGHNEIEAMKNEVAVSREIIEALRREVQEIKTDERRGKGASLLPAKHHLPEERFKGEAAKWKTWIAAVKTYCEEMDRGMKNTMETILKADKEVEVTKQWVRT